MKFLKLSNSEMTRESSVPVERRSSQEVSRSIEDKLSCDSFNVCNLKFLEAGSLFEILIKKSLTWSTCTLTFGYLLIKSLGYTSISGRSLRLSTTQTSLSSFVPLFMNKNCLSLLMLMST